MPRRKRKDETAKSRGVELRSIYIPQEVLDDPSFGRNSLPAYSTIFPEEGAAGDTSTRSSGNFKYAFVNLAGPSANGDDPRNSYKAAMGNPVYNNPKGASSNAKGKDKHYAVSASPAATTGSGNAKAAQGQGHQQQKGAVVVSGGASGVDNTAFTSSFSSLEGTYWCPVTCIVFNVEYSSLLTAADAFILNTYSGDGQCYCYLELYKVLR